MVSLPNLNTFITSTSTSIQRPRITRSSVVVTLAGPSSSSSLKIMDHSLRYASPCLWNQLSLSLRQPHFSTSSSISDSPIPSPITSSSFNAPSFVTPSLFRSPLKTYLFHKSYPSPPVVLLLSPGLPWRTIAWDVSSELLGFYLRGASSAWVIAIIVCLSICVSQAGIVSKWLNVGSRKQRHVIAQGL